MHPLSSLTSIAAGQDFIYSHSTRDLYFKSVRGGQLLKSNHLFYCWMRLHSEVFCRPVQFPVDAFKLIRYSMLRLRKKESFCSPDWCEKNSMWLWPLLVRIHTDWMVCTAAAAATVALAMCGIHLRIRDMYITLHSHYIEFVCTV